VYILLWLFCTLTLGDHESVQDTGAVAAEVANSSFLVVQTDDSVKSSSVAGDNASEAIDSETPNVTETKPDDNESFYFVDDKSVSLNAGSAQPQLSAASQHPTDTEAEEEQPRQDDNPGINTETAVKAPVTETQPPVASTSSPSDPDSLLTSIRLVIGMCVVVLCMPWEL